MTTRNCLCVALIAFLTGCGNDDTPNATTDVIVSPPAAPNAVPLVDTMSVYVSDRPGYSDTVPEYLDQGWDHETRMEWWYTSQGSRVVPYDWYLALEMADSAEPINSSRNMQRLRFVEWPADETWNPGGLPIGFARDIDKETERTYFGFTCAACHTGMIERDGKQWIIEGGPAHSDFNQFVTEIGDSLKATRDDDAKFARFTKNVLGEGADQSVIDNLLKVLAIVEANLVTRIKANEPPHPNGYARLDAFGNIFNEGLSSRSTFPRTSNRRTLQFRIQSSGIRRSTRSCSGTAPL